MPRGEERRTSAYTTYPKSLPSVHSSGFKKFAVYATRATPFQTNESAWRLKVSSVMYCPNAINSESNPEDKGKRSNAI